MRIEKLTIEGIRYWVQASMIHLPCDECALSDKSCKFLCQAIAEFNQTFAVVIKEDDNE